MATLRVISGPATGRILTIDRRTVIGRINADLVIEDDQMSRNHAVVEPVEGGVVVEDLGSTNGTFVDGERIDRPVRLTQDARLRVGRSDLALSIPEAARGTVMRDRAVSGPAEATQARRAPAPAPQATAPAAPAPPAEPPAAEPPAAPPRTTGTPPRPPSASPPAPRPRRGPPGREWLVRGGILLGALVIVVVLIVAQTGKTRHTHTLQNTLKTAVLSQAGLSITFVGLVTGVPTGAGTASVDQTFVPPPGKQPLGIGVPTKFTAKTIARFDDGSITSLVTGTATRQPDTSVRVLGRGTIVDGAGKYDGATGSFTQTGGRPPHSDRAVFTLTGSVRY
jgi:pSer/pThr/pTyr-binding forkhead associated (FHA) protein